MSNTGLTAEMRSAGAGMATISFALVTSVGSVAIADPTIADLFNQFQSASSIRFSGAVAVEQVAPDPGGGGGDPICCVTDSVQPGDPIGGYIEFWGSGPNYRINSYLDPQKSPDMQTQVAYDSAKFQLLLSNGTLALSSQDSNTILATLPNPLLQLLQFRYPITDANSQYETRLVDVLNDSPPPGFFQVQWLPVPNGSAVFRRAIFPGGTYDGVSYDHRVYATSHHLNRPVAIDRVAANGTVLTSTEFSDYIRYDTLAGPAYWPLSVIVHAYNPSTGAEEFRISFSLTDLGIDEDIPLAAFQIDTSTVERVWDGDLGSFTAPE